MALRIAGPDDVKMRCFCLDVFDQVSRKGKIILRCYIWKNIPSQS